MLILHRFPSLFRRAIIANPPVSFNERMVEFAKPLGDALHCHLLWPSWASQQRSIPGKHISWESSHWARFFSVRAHRKTLVIRQQAFRHVFSSNLLSSFHLSFPAHGIRPRFPHIPSPVQHAGNEAVGPARARGANTGRPPCRGLTVILQKRRRQLACQRRGSFPNATLPQIPGYKA